MMFSLAAKHGIALPYASVDAVRAAYAFHDLQSFLDLYYAGCDVLRDRRDFYALAMAYFTRAHADNVVHAELFFDPQTHTARGIADGGRDRRPARRDGRRARAATASRSELILCFLRHLSEADALATLDAALPFRERLRRRRPRLRRARQPAEQVRARVRQGARARPARGRARRRGGPGRVHPRGARSAARSSASITACAATRIPRWSTRLVARADPAHRVPAVEPQAVRRPRSRATTTSRSLLRARRRASRSTATTPPTSAATSRDNYRATAAALDAHRRRARHGRRERGARVVPAGPREGRAAW